MKISIITVSLNSAKVIERAITSVESQNYKDFEHIVIDGGSTDGTLSFLNSGRHNLSFWVSEPDQGIYHAMNKGLERARGDVVCFLNADDYYATAEVFGTVVKEMSLKDLDALYGDVVFFKKDNPGKIIRHYRSAGFTPDRIPSGFMPAHPALFMRRDVFTDIGGFDIRYRIAGDFEFILRAFYKNNLRYEYLPEVFVKMQSGGISTSGLRSKIQLNREVLNACRVNGVRSSWIKLLYKYLFKATELIIK